MERLYPEQVPNVPKGIKFAIYFNILGIIVLAEPAEQFSEDSSQALTPEAFGVNEVIEYSESQESAGVKEVVGGGSDTKEVGEPFL